MISRVLESSTTGPNPLPTVLQLSSVAAYDLDAGAWCLSRSHIEHVMGKGRAAARDLRAALPNRCTLGAAPSNLHFVL